MDKKEKILKKVGKLLTAYGVTDDEKAKFLADLQDGEADDQEELNEGEETEGEVEETMPEETTPSEEETTEEEMSTEEPKPEGDGETDTEVPSEDAPTTDAPTPSEEGEPTTEETGEVPPVEETSVAEDGQPTTEESVEQPVEPQVDYKAKYEEVQKALDGITARLNALTDALTQAGVFVAQPTENPVGVNNQEPSQTMGGIGDLSDTLAKLNR